MARRRGGKRAAKNEVNPASSAAAVHPPISISRRKLWFYRAVLALLGPVLFLLLCEAVLRLGGYGYDTAFLLPSTVKNEAVYVPNQRFAWRFFGPNFSRQPATFAIPREKPRDSVRIFVFGESAAFGDPKPEFGLPRMLEAMLGLRYPGVKFEVVNAAMTGINSHTVVPIARDCARTDGDIWVVYMGNNEVVGPFGAGTVFGPQAPNAAIIRGSLAANTTRTGQLLAALQRSFHKSPDSKSEWGGMLMFLENQVRSDDPRMTNVYRHFELNLADILAAAKESGAGVVVSTVAVNLKDCAPFASQRRPGLAGDASEKWQALYRSGRESQAAGNHDQAIRYFREAAQIDDSFAELQFAIGRSLLALGQREEAARAFALARDQDVLRFRCDSKLNEITRRLATSNEQERVLFADADQVFAQESAEGIPGSEHFYEHVHLTFEGNYLLARTIAEQISKMLPKEVLRTETAETWPAADACARRLGWTDWHRLSAVNDMLGRLVDPPFVNQSNHAEQIERLSRQAEDLRPRAQQALADAKSIFQDALSAAPDDPVLHAQLGTLLGTTGDTRAATESARRAVELQPNNAEYWMLLGATLATQQKFHEAADAFQKAVEQDPDNVFALQKLARTYAKLGRRDDAIETYQRAIQIKPRFGSAYLELGQLLEGAGQKDEAEKNYKLALENRIYRPTELAALAQFCRNRGWLAEAVANYADAIKLSPADPQLHVNAGQCLSALRRNAEARGHFEEAVRLAPNSGEARFLLGVELGRENKFAESTEQLRAAMRLMPDRLEPRVNLGISLRRQGRSAEALEQFREVLRRDPTNAVALANTRLIEAGATGQPSN